jgi:uncharacterized protein (DUF2252 family)
MRRDSSSAAKPPQPPEARLPRPAAGVMAPLPPIRQHYKPTVAERAAQGKVARKRVPRSSHAAWQPAADRPDPIALLEEQATERSPDLVPIRYGRMAASPFAFYRGGALLMASDLASTPDSGLVAQLCGDAHLMNFGLFESPERRLVFDINDFDETLPGPWEWDVKRLATSFEVGGRDRGFDATIRRRIVMDCVLHYRVTMIEMAALRAIDVWYARLDADLIREQSKALGGSDSRQVAKDLSSASGKDSLRAFSRLTQIVDGERRFRSIPPLLVPAEELLTGEERDRYVSAMEMALSSYRASLPHDRRPLFDLYRYQGIARKVVGVGSVGTRAWVMLFYGRSADDPVFLQAKMATASVLERFVGKSRYGNSGRRVVEGQRIMQSSSDILLGWYHVVGFDGLPHDFYMRQLWDGKGAFRIESMSEQAWSGYARLCAWTLARAHARTGDRVAIASYLGAGDTFDRAVADFAALYAEQNQRDHAALLEAIGGGRVQAVSGV